MEHEAFFIVLIVCVSASHVGGQQAPLWPVGFPLSSYAWNLDKAGTAKGCSAVTTDITPFLYWVYLFITSTYPASTRCVLLLSKNGRNVGLIHFALHSRSGPRGPSGVSYCGRRPKRYLHRSGESKRWATDPCGGVRWQWACIRYHFLRTQVLWGWRVRF